MNWRWWCGVVNYDLVYLATCYMYCNNGMGGGEVKENVQMISWGIEFVTFITATLVVWFIWHMSKRASLKNKAKQEKLKAIL